MAKAIYWQRGETLDYINGGDTKIEANTIVALEAMIGVAGTDIAAGETGSLHVSGVYEMPKTSENAIAQGTPVFWDGSGITETESGNTPAGYVAVPAAEGDTTIQVKLLG